MTRIFADTVMAPGDSLQIKGDEFHYLKNVRRVSEGESVAVYSSDGEVYIASVMQIKAKAVVIQVIEVLSVPNDALAVRVASAVPKAKLIDDSLRKMNEIGVERFSPVICDRSVVVPKTGKQERWQRIVHESIRQCGRQKPLALDAPVPLGELVRSSTESLKLLLHPDELALSVNELILKEKHANVLVLVGPEGGFTDAEVALATANGFVACSLGPFIMRIETAVVAGAAIASLLIR